MHRLATLGLTAAILHGGIAAAPGLAKGPSVPVPTVAGEAGAVVAAAPLPEDVPKNRFISFGISQPGWTAMRVTLVSLHHVDPGYPMGGSTPFTHFEGQRQFVGPPVRYVESRTTGIPFYTAHLQCEPYYHDWSTIGVLHVTGEAVIPSSVYDVEILAAACAGAEEDCSEVSPPLTLTTARWGNIATSADAMPGPTDFADISALMDKFKNAPDAPTKVIALLAGENPRGFVDATPEFHYAHVAVAVDAFRGYSYPHQPGRCTNLSTRSCITDAQCADEEFGSGLCILCGTVSGGACCRSDGTCDVVPAAACDGWFRGEGSPCSRCCGLSGDCGRLTDIEWFDVSSHWPALDRLDVCKEAESDPAYNCVSWAVNVTDDWIWDDVDVDRDGLFELSDFEAYFADHQLPVILYGGGNDGVLHTARPLGNNCASSKLGEGIRLRHDRNQIEGGFYGDILATYAY
jgi:hypothetical protein